MKMIVLTFTILTSLSVFSQENVRVVFDNKITYNISTNDTEDEVTLKQIKKIQEFHSKIMQKEILEEIESIKRKTQASHYHVTYKLPLHSKTEGQEVIGINIEFFEAAFCEKNNVRLKSIQPLLVHITENSFKINVYDKFLKDLKKESLGINNKLRDCSDKRKNTNENAK